MSAYNFFNRANLNRDRANRDRDRANLDPDRANTLPDTRRSYTVNSSPKSPKDDKSTISGADQDVEDPERVRTRNKSAFSAISRRFQNLGLFRSSKSPGTSGSASEADDKKMHELNAKGNASVGQSIGTKKERVDLSQGSQDGQVEVNAAENVQLLLQLLNDLKSLWLVVTKLEKIPAQEGDQDSGESTDNEGKAAQLFKACQTIVKELESEWCREAKLNENKSFGLAEENQKLKERLIAMQEILDSKLYSKDRSNHEVLQRASSDYLCTRSTEHFAEQGRLTRSADPGNFVDLDQNEEEGNKTFSIVQDESLGLQ